jgi:hypothetical protein
VCVCVCSCKVVITSRLHVCLVLHWQKMILGKSGFKVKCFMFEYVHLKVS